MRLAQDAASERQAAARPRAWESHLRPHRQFTATAATASVNTRNPTKTLLHLHLPYCPIFELPLAARVL